MKPYAQRVLEEIRQVVEAIPPDRMEPFLEILWRARRIYIAGVGRSGLMVKAFGQRMVHLGFEVHLADEITAPGIGRRDVLVCCSGTGRTQLTLYMARKARSVGARVVSLTAAKSSPLRRLSDVVIEIPAPLEPGRGPRGTVQPARSLFEQALLVFLDASVLALMERLKIPRARIERRHANLE